MQYYENYISKAKNIEDYNQHPDIELNDFDAFETYLFPSAEERQVWDKFKKFMEPDGPVFDMYCPIDKPSNLVEAQINHYVMWNCMAIYPHHCKPIYMLSFNRSKHNKVFLPNPICICFACETVVFRYGDKHCECCPIWGLTSTNPRDIALFNYDAPCEDYTNFRDVPWYNLFINTYSQSQDAIRYCEELAKVEWKDIPLIPEIEDDEIHNWF